MILFTHHQAAHHCRRQNFRPARVSVESIFKTQKTTTKVLPSATNGEFCSTLTTDRFQSQPEALLTFAGLVLQLVGCYSMTPLLSIIIMFFSRNKGRTEL